MIGEFLLSVTFLQVSIVFIISIIFLGIVAYKKPSWYKDTLKTYAIIIGLIFIYSLGWENAVDHHDIPYLEQSNIESYSILGNYCFFILIDNLWFAPVMEKRLEESDSEEEEN